MTTEHDMLHAEVRLGMQVEIFFRSDIGRYITGRAAEEEKLLMQQLVDGRVTSVPKGSWHAQSKRQWRLSRIRFQTIARGIRRNSGYLSGYQIN